jgi:hypothetical protein
MGHVILSTLGVLLMACASCSDRNELIGRWSDPNAPGVWVDFIDQRTLVWANPSIIGDQGSPRQLGQRTYNYVLSSEGRLHATPKDTGDPDLEFDLRVTGDSLSLAAPDGDKRDLLYVRVQS